MTIKTLRLVPGDTAAHPLSATPILAQFLDVWPEEGSGTIRLGNSEAQYGYAPYGFRPDNHGASPYDLSKLYYQATDAAYVLCVAYAPH